jgi:hypothetical protein
MLVKTLNLKLKSIIILLGVKLLPIVVVIIINNE